MPEPEDYRTPEERHLLLEAVDRLDRSIAALTLRFDGLEDANQAIRHQQDTLNTQQGLQRKTQRWQKVQTFCIIAVLIFGALVITQNRHNARIACESGNRRVLANQAASREDWEINQAAAKAQGFTEGSPLRDFYDARLKWQLEEQFPLRDCEHLSEPIPLPGEPPSYDEALREALKFENRRDHRQSQAE